MSLGGVGGVSASAIAAAAAAHQHRSASAAQRRRQLFASSAQLSENKCCSSLSALAALVAALGVAGASSARNVGIGAASCQHHQRLIAAWPRIIKSAHHHRGSSSRLKWLGGVAVLNKQAASAASANDVIIKWRHKM